MAGRARLWLLVVGASVLAAPLAGLAAADHADCPSFERLRYDYTVEFHHGGDLFSTVHVVGFTDFRFCFELRDRVVSEEIRWESRGGLYHLQVNGHAFNESHLLRDGNNRTRWYDHADVVSIRALGVGGDGTPTLIPDETPPARAPSSGPGRIAPSWADRLT